MRRVTFLGLGAVKDPAVKEALNEIQRASSDVDLTTIAQNFTITGSYTPTRTLNVSTATLANLIAFVATFIADCQKGGENRTR